MTEQILDKRYFSIKWQTFSLTSLVLVTIFAAFLFFVSESSLRQFETGRHHVYQQNKQQLDSLIEASGEKIIQLANTSVLNGQLASGLMQHNQARLQTTLDDLSWPLQVDAGVQSLSIYNTQGQILSLVGDVGVSKLVLQVLETESPQWTVVCDAECHIQGATPILSAGDVVGVFLLSEPLSNVMLRFQHLSNIDTGLLTSDDSSNEFHQFIPSWDKNLVALTNPKASKAIINNASRLYSLKELTDGVRLVDLNSQVFELRALPIKDNQVVVISNVSQDVLSMEKSRADSLRVSVASLIIAELLLLSLLWKPMARIKKTVNILPLLAERKYHEATQSFKELSKKQIFADETDVFNVTALRLSTELETLQGQIETGAEKLEIRGAELEKERDFASQLLDTVQAIIIIQDENGLVQSSNKFAVRLSGYSAIEMMGKGFLTLLDESGETEAVGRRINDVISGQLSEYQHESILNTRNGDRLHLAWRHAILYNHESDTRQVLSVAVDVSARVKAEGELAWLANHDALTGLLNRRRFEEELNRSFAEVKRFKRSFALILIHLDHCYASINTHESHKSAGYDAADTLIKAVAKTLEAESRETDQVARLSSDKFGLMISSLEPGEIATIANRICHTLENSVLPEEKDSERCAASLGVAIMSSELLDEITDIDSLLTRAHAASYEAKKQGKNRWSIFKQA
jgi:diguanylate cyclase (GGDEF)-like protein/PAS domain S-box-containing protein